MDARLVPSMGRFEAKQKESTLKFTIDCLQPADDNIIEPKDFEKKFLMDKIKVEGKTGHLGDG